MKKSASVLALILLLTMTACSNQGTQSDVSSLGSNAKSESPTLIYDGIWPENEYTDGLPIPAGTVEWVMLDSAKGYCAINIEEISETDYNAYMELLKEAGFSVTNEVSEEVEGQDYVSIGTIMSDGERGLSISFIPGNLGIRISYID